mmetsp:Transcript_29077/g.43842  ORF Transcript_29077/g.43842 Transcript_29077/m.43842 type:complete len:179 (-) Transcript_29077:925-1461(-)
MAGQEGVTISVYVYIGDQTKEEGSESEASSIDSSSDSSADSSSDDTEFKKEDSLIPVGGNRRLLEELDFATLFANYDATLFKEYIIEPGTETAIAFEVGQAVFINVVGEGDIDSALPVGGFQFELTQELESDNTSTVDPETPVIETEDNPYKISFIVFGSILGVLVLVGFCLFIGMRQ